MDGTLQEEGPGQKARHGIDPAKRSTSPEDRRALVTHYGVAKREAVDGLLEMFERGVVQPTPWGCAVKVLHAMKSSGQKPGLVDRFIHAQYSSLPAGMATFEKASRKLSGVVVLAR